MRNKIIIGFVCLAISFVCLANIASANIDFGKNEKILKQDLHRYFKGYDGCFILYNQNKKEYIVYNEEKCKKRTSPHSTYKIYLTLIGLQTGVLKDENTKMKWNGIRYPIDSWNRDQTLSSAITNSVNWYYDNVSLEIGQTQIERWLDKINYGNKDLSGKTYKGEQCLPTSLEISPAEQVELLQKMYTYRLPFDKRNIDLLKKLLILAKAQDTVLSGKTGTNQGVSGWFVGYVEKSGNNYFFATNIEKGMNSSGAIAKKTTLQILNDMKITPLYEK